MRFIASGAVAALLCVAPGSAIAQAPQQAPAKAPQQAPARAPQGALSLDWTVQSRVKGMPGGFLVHQLTCQDGRCALQVVRLSDCSGNLAVLKALHFTTGDSLEAVTDAEGLRLEYRDGVRLVRQRLVYAAAAPASQRPEGVLQRVSGVILEASADGTLRPAGELVPLAGPSGLSLVRYDCPLAMPAVPKD